jgi:microcompartment protein CcmL/EutN
MPDEMNICVGLTEYTSIAKGIEAADAMIKRAEVKLIFSKPVCAGKYITMITGRVEAVKSSVQSALDIAGANCIDHLIIPNIHPKVLPAFFGTQEIKRWDALGVIETFTIASCVVASDLAAKAGEIDLVEIRLGVGLGGKAYVVMTGEIADVESAVSAGSLYAKEHGTLVNSIIIPRPHKDLNLHLM